MFFFFFLKKFEVQFENMTVAAHVLHYKAFQLDTLYATHRIKIMKMPHTMGLQSMVRQMYHADYSQICKFCIYKKIPDLGSQVHHLSLFSHMQPTNQPTATDVALCHKKAEDICSNPICLRGDYLFSQISLFHMKNQASHVSVPQQLHKYNQQYHHTHHVNKCWKQHQFHIMRSPEILNTDELSKRVKPLL